jgi:glycerol-3-phosphate acyltransferase PlsY
VGSGNTGASNVQRTMGWKYGWITFFGDAVKGILACWSGYLLTGNHMVSLASGLFAILGHNWPVFFGFKGGKGVATSCGVLLYCFPIPALICFALTVVLIALTRYISLGSMFLLTSYALIVSLSYPGPWRTFVITWTFILTVLCILRHHQNIRRLLQGKENMLGKGRKEGKKHE